MAWGSGIWAVMAWRSHVWKVSWGVSGKVEGLASRGGKGPVRTGRVRSVVFMFSMFGVGLGDGIR